MSRDYAESNQETAKELFEKRSRYSVRALESADGYTNLVDFNFGEKYLYGRVNRLFVPITFSKGSLTLKAFDKANAAEKNLSAVNFVVDAFKGLALEFQRCAAQGQIDSNDPFLSNLIVYKAYENPEVAYNNYLTVYQQSISTEFKRRNIRVKNFTEFMKEFMLLMETSARNHPFSKPAYIKSRFCPVTCSGLAIEIGNLNYANDEEKFNQFIKSKNWEFYLNACRTYGFMVDRHIPWRLVADIGSSPMIEYASKYGANTTNKVLNLGYVNAYGSFFAKFKFFLLNLYNQVKLQSFVETRPCGMGTQNIVVTPQTYTADELSQIYPEEYFLRAYFKLRFLEEESIFKDFEKEMLIDDSIELYYSKGLSLCLETAARIINKTFDYRGSLSYIREYIQARDDAEGP